MLSEFLEQLDAVESDLFTRIVDEEFARNAHSHLECVQAGRRVHQEIQTLPTFSFHTPRKGITSMIASRTSLSSSFASLSKH